MLKPRTVCVIQQMIDFVLFYLSVKHQNEINLTLSLRKSFVLVSFNT